MRLVEVAGTVGYWVGDDGSVWTIWREHSGNTKRAQEVKRQLRGSPDRNGYIQVKIDRKNRKVHHLVLEAFVGPQLEGLECRHLDGDHANNNADNLAWGTKLDNWNDKVRHGRDNVGHCHGDTNGKAKLTREQAEEIKRLYLSGISPRKIGVEFGINRNHVRHIAIGKKWRNLVE